MTAAAEIVLPLSDQISFRPETLEDEAFLAKLYATTRDIEMALTGWDAAQQEAFLRMQFQFQTTHYRQHYGDALFQIILRDNAPIGRIYLHYGPSQIRLMDIALLPEYRRSGIGSSILENLLREAAQLGKPVTLHVERFNPALRLYERLGFRMIEDLGINLYMEWRPPAA
jgi:ribosomal protein S18 acetylase RimI-like enzyme